MRNLQGAHHGPQHISVNIPDDEVKFVIHAGGPCEAVLNQVLEEVNSPNVVDTRYN